MPPSHMPRNITRAKINRILLCLHSIREQRRKMWAISSLISMLQLQLTKTLITGNMQRERERENWACDSENWRETHNLCAFWIEISILFAKNKHNQLVVIKVKEWKLYVRFKLNNIMKIANRTTTEYSLGWLRLIRWYLACALTTVRKKPYCVQN